MTTNLIRYIWQYSRTQQLWLIALTLAAFPLLYASLEIPKLIINEALSGAPGLRQFMGYSWEPLPLLLTLSFTLLALVLINGLIKMYINTRKGMVGEILVRRLRYQLMERLLRFPRRKFQTLSPGEIIASVVQETDPLGGFSGDAFAHPILQGGTLLTILLFMFMQNWLLGVASVALVPVQLYIIPRLQRQINRLRKERVKRVRVLSNRIGETVQASNEIRIQGTRRYTQAEFSYRFGELYYIRLELFKKKFFMKFVNNTLNQLTPFMFYALGGYLVLQGELTVGALVAAIAAHKDFLAPWRELLNFYQIWQDNVVRYRQVIEQFSPHDLQALPAPDEQTDESVFTQPLVLRNINIRNEQGEPLISHLNLQVEPGEWLAIQSETVFLRTALGCCLAGLDKPYSGFAGFGNIPLERLPEPVRCINIGFVNDQPYMFSAAISYNLGYGLNHAPPPVTSEEQQTLLADAAVAGNSPDWFDESFETVWSDLQRFGAESWDEIQDWLSEQTEVIGSREILLRLSLNEVFNPLNFPEQMFSDMVDNLLSARQVIQNELKTGEHCDKAHFDHYDIHQLNRFAPLMDNLIFGTLVGDTQVLRPTLLQTITEVLEEQGLLETTLEIAEKGLQRLMLQYPRLPDNHPYLDQFELHDEERVKSLERVCSQLEVDLDLPRTEEAIREPLMDIFVRLVPQDWLEIWLHPEYVQQLIALRPMLSEKIQQTIGSAYFPFIEGKFNPGLSVLNNVLYGRIDPQCEASQHCLQERAVHWVRQKASEFDLVRLFMVNTHAGVNGSRLPEAARHRISLLRTLIKRPRILILQDSLPGTSQEELVALLQRLKASHPDISLIWVNEKIPDKTLFDRCVILGNMALGEFIIPLSSSTRPLSSISGKPFPGTG